jgi:hypothetical protein
MILNVCCLIGQGFWKRKIRTHIVSFVNEIHHKKKNYTSRGTFVFVKNDTLSLNIGVILFFFKVKFMHIFDKYCLGVWENDFTDILIADLAVNISRENKIGICPNCLRIVHYLFLTENTTRNHRNDNKTWESVNTVDNIAIYELVVLRSMYWLVATMNIWICHICN